MAPTLKELGADERWCNPTLVEYILCKFYRLGKFVCGGTREDKEDFWRICGVGDGDVASKKPTIKSTPPAAKPDVKRKKPATSSQSPIPAVATSPRGLKVEVVITTRRSKRLFVEGCTKSYREDSDKDDGGPSLKNSKGKRRREE
ncbi:hypothetical protein HDV00_001738 [Rhizophlyctis rosea]|nr:hypothetical protein HDV00_001738 [Rhizophlyctis rosea]